MPLLKLCKCGKKIEYSKQMCNSCQEKQEQRQRESNRYYDKYTRDQKSKAFYQSSAWKRMRLIMLSRYKYIDVYEYIVNGRLVAATTVHHIEELKDKWSRRLDEANLMPVSQLTHNMFDGLYKSNKRDTQQMLFKILEEAKEKL